MFGQIQAAMQSICMYASIVVWVGVQHLVASIRALSITVVSFLLVVSVYVVVRQHNR